jgi:hypothetical protein
MKWLAAVALTTAAAVQQPLSFSIFPIEGRQKWQ